MNLSQQNSLERFISAQAKNYNDALAEIENGKKQTHWMWYVFPQIQGLGSSETAKFYAIKDKNEAESFLQHPLLGARLVEISKALLKLESSDAYKILGSPDDMKLLSSMTLFAALPNTDEIFDLVLQKFFNGTKDLKTIELLDTGN